MPEMEAGALGSRWRELPGIEHIPVPGKVAFTFDDGPDSGGTPAVLDALDAAGARATFFVLGTQLLRHATIAREAAARGHELALHGFDHSDHDRLGPREAREQIERGAWTFEVVLGHRPRWFRPPFGRMCEASYAACQEHRLEIVYWSAVGQDWEPISARQIASNVSKRLAPGRIVLLHDSSLFAARSSCAPTAEAVKLLAEGADAAGIALDTVTSLIEVQTPAERR